MDSDSKEGAPPPGPERLCSQLNLSIRAPFSSVKILAYLKKIFVATGRVPLPPSAFLVRTAQTRAVPCQPGFFSPNVCAKMLRYEIEGQFANEYSPIVVIDDGRTNVLIIVL